MQDAVPAFRQYGGSFEPIIVRQKQGSHRFELIAGEQRLRVTRAAGAKTITARVIRNCSDSEALDIFALTNIQRRSTTISDQIYGWGLVVENHTNQGARSDLARRIPYRHISKGCRPHAHRCYRYLALRALVLSCCPALDSGKLSIRAGEKSRGAVAGASARDRPVYPSRLRGNRRPARSAGEGRMGYRRGGRDHHGPEKDSPAAL